MTDVEQVTLNAIREWAEGNNLLLELEEVSDHARGYCHAVRDVLKILDMHDRSAHEPVESGE